MTQWQVKAQINFELGRANAEARSDYLEMSAGLLLIFSSQCRSIV